jgi:hypothetical protein
VEEIIETAAAPAGMGTRVVQTMLDILYSHRAVINSVRSRTVSIEQARLDLALTASSLPWRAFR